MPPTPNGQRPKDAVKYPTMHKATPTTKIIKQVFNVSSATVSEESDNHLRIFEDIEYMSEGTQSCPTLCDPMDCSLPDSSVHGILQARVLEWVAISFSNI